MEKNGRRDLFIVELDLSTTVYIGAQFNRLVNIATETEGPYWEISIP